MEIKNFNYDMLDDLKYNPSIILCSQRGGGKSFLLNSLMKKLDSKFRYSHIFAFSQTDRFTGQMENFVPNDYIFDSLDALDDIITTRTESKVPIDKRSNICIIMNDIAGLREQNKYNRDTRGIKNSGNLEKLFSLGRHNLRATIVVLVQSLLMVSPLVRLNTDLTFFWTSKNSLVRKKIKEEYLGLATKREADEIYDKVFDGTPYICFVVNSWMQGTTKLNQFVFKFLAPKMKKWKSKFVKNYKKKTKRNNNKIITNEKNNVFTIYNEVEESRIQTKRNYNTRSKRLKSKKLPNY
jgi:Txe/YoeB family toxin of Txe-Axe toxin-antitoxin module